MVRISETDLRYGFEFINTVSIEDGSVEAYLTSVVQKPPVPDVNIEAAIVMAGGRVLLADRKAGLMSWSAEETNKIAWRYLPKSSAFVSYGASGTIMLIEEDLKAVRLLDAKTGKVKASGTLPQAATGSAVATGKGFFVPVQGALLLLADDMTVKARVQVDGLSGAVRGFEVPGGIVLADSDEILRVPLM